MSWNHICRQQFLPRDAWPIQCICTARYMVWYLYVRSWRSIEVAERIKQRAYLRLILHCSRISPLKSIQVRLLLLLFLPYYYNYYYYYYYYYYYKQCNKLFCNKLAVASLLHWTPTVVYNTVTWRTASRSSSATADTCYGHYHQTRTRAV